MKKLFKFLLFKQYRFECFLFEIMSKEKVTVVCGLSQKLQ